MSLRGEFGWVLGFTAWVTVLRVVFTFINRQLRDFAEQNIAEAGAIQRIFDSLPYRILAFLINMVASIKLPTTGRKVAPENQHLP